MSVRILIVDDDPVQRRLIEAAVTRFGHVAVVAENGQVAMEILERDDAPFGAIILDLVMPGLDGMGVLKAMAERGIERPVIVQTAQGGIDSVVHAMRAGAFDFVVKPASPERLKVAIANALKVEERGNEVRRQARRGGDMPFTEIVTRSPVMEKVLRLARKAAASTIPVLIEGESGVGKELVARAIQGAGDRRGKPFVTVNCGAIPDNLVESILFGHEKGAFTGATDKHVGKFMEANGGTLFLDEIGDLPLPVQVKLLRAVQQGEIEPVGARTSQKVDIRLVSATHRDLFAQVKEGRFREDLYYRLNVYPIAVPPLRERKEDVEPLIRHFLKRFANEGAGGRERGISGRAVALLEAYDWPGNIRQLENAVFRATVLCEGDVLTEDEFPHIRAQVEGTVNLDQVAPRPALSGLGWSAPASEPPASPPAMPDVDAPGGLSALDETGQIRALADIEHEMILMAIDHYAGQMSEVARRLGIGRSTLYRKLKDYGIDPETGRSNRAAS
jgi:DNA-binding NtrC family response regulator